MNFDQQFRMHKISSQTLLILALVFALSQAVIFNKQINSADPKALCLNGAQSFFYASNLTSIPTGIIVYFMPTPTPLFCGGSSLSTSLDNCVTISDEVSSYWVNQLIITSGILADPTYDSWAKVIIPACDGAIFQGSAPNPTPYKGKNLYFRGNRVVRSNLEYIFHKKFNASKITQFVLAGSGLGASGALIWSRYFYDEIVLSSGNNKRFSLILDSILYSYPSMKTKSNEYEAALKNMLKVANVDQLTPFVLCALRNQGEEHRCFKLQQTYYYLNFPVFWIDSQYDYTSLQRVLETNCVDKTTGSLDMCLQPQRNYIAEYRSSKLVSLYAFVNFHANSVWSISCASTSLLNNDKYNNQSWRVGDKLAQSVNNFIAGLQITSFNHFPWPNNAACSGQK